jgi:hypothetical protein
MNAYAGGTRGAAPGWAWVGERGPELAYFRGGETVLPSHISMAVTGGYANGTPGAGIPIQIENVVMLDGNVVHRAVEQRVYAKNIQNGMRMKSGSVQGRFGVR